MEGSIVEKTYLGPLKNRRFIPERRFTPFDRPVLGKSAIAAFCKLS